MLMKKFIPFAMLVLFSLGALGQAVVIYNSDDPFSSAAAAITTFKRGVSYKIDCAENDSAAQVAWFATLPSDSSMSYCYIVCDTSSLYTADKWLQTYSDSITIQVLGTESITYYVGTVNATKCEQTWSGLYSGVTAPLIVGYLSETLVWYDRGDASGGTTASVFKANPSGWTAGTWVGDYVAITAGPGMGESLPIAEVIAAVSGDADTLSVTGTFTAAITSGSDFTVVPSSLHTRWVFNDMYSYYGVLVEIADPFTYAKQWGKLIDNDGRLNSLQSGESPAQDITYLNTLLLVGKNVFDYLVEVN